VGYRKRLKVGEAGNWTELRELKNKRKTYLKVDDKDNVPLSSPFN
jgi:hypothetical protein